MLTYCSTCLPHSRNRESAEVDVAKNKEKLFLIFIRICIFSSLLMKVIFIIKFRFMISSMTVPKCLLLLLSCFVMILIRL